jgi:hypothetical protein
MDETGEGRLCARGSRQRRTQRSADLQSALGERSPAWNALATDPAPDRHFAVAAGVPPGGSNRPTFPRADYCRAPIGPPGAGPGGRMPPSTAGETPAATQSGVPPGGSNRPTFPRADYCRAPIVPPGAGPGGRMPPSTAGATPAATQSGVPPGGSNRPTVRSPGTPEIGTACRLGNRRCNRLGNLRYAPARCLKAALGRPSPANHPALSPFPCPISALPSALRSATVLPDPPKKHPRTGLRSVRGFALGHFTPAV